jgi:23S rRNA (cytidine1920-2'-O)/16S rRNA (cytidine1409-2'-O)-methyltransferase
VPAAAALLKPGGRIISLVKPQYEAQREQLRKGVVDVEAVPHVLQETLDDLARRGLPVSRWIDSPIAGQAGNREYLALVEPRGTRTTPT